MTPNSIEFQGKRYVEHNDAPVTRVEGFTYIGDLSGPDCVTLYNLIASNIEKSTVRRFENKLTANRRIWQMLLQYQDTIKAEAAAFEATPAELDAQKTRATVRQDKPEEEPKAFAGITDRHLAIARNGGKVPKAQLGDGDKAAIREEAKGRETAPKAAKRGSQAGTIRKPRQPKADDGKIKLPAEGGKQRARKQKDGSYAFRIPAGKPRTTKISEERQELIDLFKGGEETWASIKAVLDKRDDFCTVTTITMACITLGFGLETDPETGLIKYIEPLA